MLHRYLTLLHSTSRPPRLSPVIRPSRRARIVTPRQLLEARTSSRRMTHMGLSPTHDDEPPTTR